MAAEMTTYLIAVAALGLAWLIRSDNWRRMFRWWLVALAAKAVLAGWVLANGNTDQIETWLSVSDPVVLVLQVFAVLEAWILLTARVHTDLWRAMAGVSSGCAVFWVAVVAGYLAEGTATSIYSDVRMCAHFSLLAALGVAWLWIHLRDIPRIPQAAAHAGTLAATLVVYVVFDIYPSGSLEEWRQVQQWNSALLLGCLGWWIVNALFHPSHTRVDIV